MPLSLKAELEIWAAALKAYDEQEFLKALELFSRIAHSAKILTNIGLIYATIGEHAIAVEHFDAATNLDKFLSIAHFQCGVSNFLLGRFDVAYANFEDAYLYLRGNQAINYEQLGLKFQLFSTEVLFNRGLSQLYLGYTQEGMNDLEQARREKVTKEHDVIDEAIRDRGERYTVFSIPVGVLYRPPENKLKNSKTKDYLGKAKLVAASDINDAYTEFSGVTKLKQKSGASVNASLESPPQSNSNGSSRIEASSSTGSDAPALNRSITAPPLRTTSLAAGASLGRSKTTGSLLQSRTRDRDTNNGSERPYAPRGTSPPRLRFPLPPTSSPPAFRPSEIQPQSQSPSQSQPPKATPQPLQRQPQSPSHSPLQTLPSPQLLASRRSQSVSHLPIAQVNAIAGSGTAPRTALTRSNTSVGVSRGNKLVAAEQRMGSGLVAEAGRKRTSFSPLQEEEHAEPTPSSGRFAEFYDEYVGAYTDDTGVSPYGGLGNNSNNEDGVKISLRDDEDWGLAIETATRAGGSGGSINGGGNGKGRNMEGRLEIWCEDV
ncbi:hypothetical protein ID866_951 [Astraeus odoratus]|nr:hypothetical protein ID866_951 [Astraeus odoratus]